MDIIGHYSAGTPYLTPRTASQSDTGLPEVKYEAADEYRKMIEALESRQKPTDPSAKLYNGYETRAQLSNTEIAALANKYDVRDMSDQEYYAFLDDLESMGAISNYEKRRLSSDGSGEDFTLDDPRFLAARVWEAPAGADGRGPAFYRWETDGDVFQWINGRIQWQPGNPDGSPELQKELEEQVEVHKVLAGYVNRMDAQRGKTAKAAEKAELRRQIADPNSDFYTNMFAQMKANVERTKEDKEQQDIVEALGAVLEALSGKEDVSGDKASVNKAASELTKKIGGRIARLKAENPDDPEIVKLESMLQRLQEMGIYIDTGDTDGIFTDEEDSFETLTQLLTRRQKEEAISSTPQ